MLLRLLWGALAVICFSCAPPDDNPEVAERDVVVLSSRAELPAWAVPYGEEHWHPRVAGDIDLGGSIDRVTHAFRPSQPSEPLRVESDSYAATVDDTSLRFSPSSAREIEASIRTRLTLGDRELSERGVRVALGNTVQRLVDSSTGLIEHVEARASGLAITWVLPARPRVTQDLVVELSVNGAAFAAHTAMGVHYADAESRPRVVVGNAVVVDGNGDHWPVTTELIEGQPRWRVSAETLAAAAYPIALDPIIGAEVALDSPVNSEGTDQTFPSIAWNGMNYLLVWTDRGRAGIYGSLLSSGGGVATPLGTRISVDRQPQYSAVGSNGTDFLVVWQKLSADGVNFDLVGQRLNGNDGSPIEPNPFHISALSGYPDIASNGTDYLVAWPGGAVRVTAGGVVVDTSPINYGNGVRNTFSERADVASDGTDYLVVVANSKQIKGTRISSATGSPSALATDIGVGLGFFYPSVAFDGSRYLVAWDQYSNSNASIDGRFVAPDGTLAPSAFAIESLPNDAIQPTVRSNGNGFVVVWTDRRNGRYDIYGTRVTATGAVLEPGGLLVGSPRPRTSSGSFTYERAAMASDGSDYFVVDVDWESNAEGADLFGGRIRAGTGTVAPPFQNLEIGVNAQGVTAVAASDSGYLVVFMDARASPTSAYDLYGVRLSRSGDPLDVAGIPICTLAGSPGFSSATSNGVDYLISWADYRSSVGQIYAARMTADGAILEQDGFAVSPTVVSQGWPSVASDGSGYFIAWSDARNATRDIYGAHLNSDATRAQNIDLPISTADGVQDFPSVAWDGTRYMVVWIDRRTGDDVFGARVAQSSPTVLDPDGIEISSGTEIEDSAQVAATPSGFLSAWVDRSGPAAKVFAARIDSASGAVIDANANEIATSVLDGIGGLALSSNGSHFLAAWQEYDIPYTPSSHVSARRITATGVLDEASSALSFKTAPGAYAPALAGRAGGPYLLAYSRDARAVARLISDCGNAVVDTDEVCDDGNSSNGDGCTVGCAVEPGFTCTSTTCTDIDECAANNGGCLQVCNNVPGTFSCTCFAGYTENGTVCEDIDECAIDNGGCSGLVSCTNTVGARTCSACPTGYVGDGVACDDIDECATNNGGCSDLVTCTNSPGARACGACPAGFSGDGVTCMAIPGTDGGVVNDAQPGDDEPTPEPDDGGCCSANQKPPASSLLLAGALGLALRRRRRVAGR